MTLHYNPLVAYGTLAGDLAMRREMHRVNTTQQSLPGDELLAQVAASRSD